MQTVLGFWDFFWIGFVVMTCSGGTQYVLRNDDESESLAPSLKSRPTLQARIKARLLEKRRPLVRTSKWKAVRRAGVALS